jgi:hypothetical protein
LNKIAHKYIFAGWFFVDSISVFPFTSFFETGQITKLFRLARLPRLIKLIDISRFKKVLIAFQSSGKDENIVGQYIILQAYKVVRLVIIACIITYFLGCSWFYFCDNVAYHNDSNLNSFIENFELEDVPANTQLLRSSYYALTTLSTVGYGDYFPITNNERVFAVMIMLGGVAFFSYIMGNFIEILTNYEKKMGVSDKSGALTEWMQKLTRFTNNQPLAPYLVNDIEQNFRYYWNNDRISYM